MIGGPGRRGVRVCAGQSTHRQEQSTNSWRECPHATQGLLSRLRHDAKGGDCYLATSGDLDLATSGDIFMATDKPHRLPSKHCVFQIDTVRTAERGTFCCELKPLEPGERCANLEQSHADGSAAGSYLIGPESWLEPRRSVR